MKKTQSIIILFICFVSCFYGVLSSSDKPEIAKLEKGLLPPVLIKGDSPLILSERMMFHKVPGVSIAVIKDFKLHWTKGYGVMDITSGSPVTTETLFQAASISKPVAAMAALKKVQDGKLKWDENVNNFLVSWKLPENKWTSMQQVTIRHLLSHSGGVTVSGFRGYAPFEPIPSLLHLLDGKKPANSAPIRVDIEPGKRFRYAGGGYCILQQMLTPFVSSAMGLGIVVRKFGNAVYFEHSGGNEGFRCRLFAHKNKGCGAVVMTNSDSGPQLYGEILRGIANIYQWDDYLPEPYEIIEISPENLKSLPGKFAVDSDHMLTIKKENNQLYAPLTFSDKAEIFPISETKFIRRDQRVVYEFVKDPETKPQRPCAGRHAFIGAGGTIDH